MGEDPRQIRREIEETRGRMTETVEAIGYRADVKTRTKDAIVDRKDAVMEKASGIVDRVVGAAPDVHMPSKPDVSMPDFVPDRDQVRAGAKKAVSVAQSNPIGLGLGAVAVGFLAGMVLPSTRVEDERLGDLSDQLKEQAKQAGQEAMSTARRSRRTPRSPPRRPCRRAASSTASSSRTRSATASTSCARTSSATARGAVSLADAAPRATRRRPPTSRRRSCRTGAVGVERVAGDDADAVPAEPLVEPFGGVAGDGVEDEQRPALRARLRLDALHQAPRDPAPACRAVDEQLRDVAAMRLVRRQRERRPGRCRRARRPRMRRAAAGCPRSTPAAKPSNAARASSCENGAM